MMGVLLLITILAVPISAAEANEASTMLPVDVDIWLLTGLSNNGTSLSPVDSSDRSSVSYLMDPGGKELLNPESSWKNFDAVAVQSMGRGK